MGDLIDELAKIKAAEKQRERILFEAQKKADKTIASAKEELTDMTKSYEAEVPKMREEIENNYKKTMQLLFAKLRKDSDARLDSIKKADVEKLAEDYESAVIELLREHGNPASETTR